MSTILSAHEFYALHQSLIIQAFGSEEVLEKKNNSQVYGLNDYDGKDTLSGKMRKELKENVYTKALYDKKKEFNNLLDIYGNNFNIKIGPKHLRQYVQYLKKDNPGDYKEIVEEFYKKKGISVSNFPLKKIQLKGDNQKDDFSDSKGVMTNVSDLENIRNFAKTQHWWLYFYEYKSSNEQERRSYLMRILFQIKKVEGQYVVDYINSSPKYTSYNGKVVFVTSKTMIIQLKDEFLPKQLFLIVNLDPKGDKPLYIGIYNKHDSEGKVYAGSFILQRIPKNVTNHQAKVFDILDTDSNEVPSAIKKFFLHKKYTFLKTPKVYNLKRLEDWLDEKMKSRGEISNYDFFLAAPILSLKRNEETCRKANSSIKKELKEEGVLLNPELQNNLSEIFSKLYFGDEYQKVFSFGHMEFLQKVQEFEAALKSKHGLSIYNSRSKEQGFDIDLYYPFPSQTFKNDLDAIKKSRAFVLICPYPHLFSSCWVQVGWAITLDIPIFLICKKREYLTFILTAAFGARDHTIELIEMDFTLDLEKILLFLSKNDLWRETFIEDKN